MGTNQVLFWSVLSAFAIAAGWWLAARPRASMRGIAVPVTALMLVLSVLVLLLSSTGQDFRVFLLSVRELAS
ncbi:MAG: hypothetical protein GX547_06200 [Phycisphaerae bacterium]|nr:hypothetical protein [Phycisphaerae bacterium]